MPKTEGTKKVRIYFHHLLMTYSMNRNVVPQPSIDDCVDFFTRSLQYTLSSPVQDRKVDFAADEQIVWLDGCKVTKKLLDDRRTMTTFEITIKSAKYNQVRNVRNTNTMEEKGLLKEIMDGDDESTHFLISHITGRNNLICVQESNYYGIRMGKFTQYLRKRMEAYRASINGPFDFWFDHEIFPSDAFLDGLKDTQKITVLTVYTSKSAANTFVDLSDRDDLRDETQLVLKNPRRGKYIHAQTIKDYYSAMSENQDILRITAQGQRYGIPFTLDTEGSQMKTEIAVKLTSKTKEVVGSSFFEEANQALRTMGGIEDESYSESVMSYS